MSGQNGRINSAVAIARLLDSEGFTDHTAQAVMRYAQRRSGFTDNQRRHWQKRITAFREITVKLSPGEKLILGKFIAARQKASFDAGLRIGLTACVTEHNKVFGNEDWMLNKPIED